MTASHLHLLPSANSTASHWLSYWLRWFAIVERFVSLAWERTGGAGRTPPPACAEPWHRQVEPVVLLTGPVLVTARAP